MKKFLFIFCSLLIIYFGFNIEVYAEDYYVKFDTSVFSSDDLTTAVWSLCPEGACRYYCNGGVNDFSTNIADCGGGLESVEAFSINVSKDTQKGAFIYVKEYLGKKNCPSNSNNTCLSFIKENYCHNKKEPSFCGYLDGSKGDAVQESPNEVSCPISKVQLFAQKKGANFSGSFENFKIYIIDSKLSLGYSDSENNAVLVDDSQINFSNNSFYLYGKNSNFNSFNSDFMSRFKNNKCPSILWCSTGKKESGYYKFYAEFGDKCDTNVYGDTAVSQTTDEDGESSGVSLDLSAYESHYAHGLIGKETSILDCDTLLSGDGESDGIIKILKIIVNIVKFIVPVILIVMGSLDFIQAIFAQDDGAMKKAQGKFIKRVIIAIIIFLIPSALKLILTIANSIWPAISSDFCGIL